MLVLFSKNNRLFYLHLISILVFTLLYYLSQINQTNDNYSLTDCLYFSLVTQSTVGYGHIYPNNNFMKYISILQILFLFIILIIN